MIAISIKGTWLLTGGEVISFDPATCEFESTATSVNSGSMEGESVFHAFGQGLGPFCDPYKATATEIFSGTIAGELSGTLTLSEQVHGRAFGVSHVNAQVMGGAGDFEGASGKIQFTGGPESGNYQGVIFIVSE